MLMFLNINLCFRMRFHRFIDFGSQCTLIKRDVVDDLNLRVGDRHSIMVFTLAP